MRKKKKEDRDYSILFLLLKEQQKVYMDISFARDFGAVLRKHWHGQVPCTKELFSHENPQAKPEMLVWEIGYVSRETAYAFLGKWEEVFLQNGYKVIASQLKAVTLIGSREFRRSVRSWDINFDKLMRGVDVKRVTCRKAARNKKSAAQKYAAEAAEDVLNIRTTWAVSNAFREFCKEKGLTQSQGLSVLVETAGATSNNLLERDLQKRLEIADDVVTRKDEKIQMLQKQLEEKKGSELWPARVEAAMLQNILLQEFFTQLPRPVFSEEDEEYGFERLLNAFPEAKDYQFPEEYGIYFVYLEHVRESKQRNGMALVYGKSHEGEKLKFCYPYVRGHHYGEELWESPYLIKGYPWLLAVQKRTEFAYIVGALPLFDLDRISDWRIEAELGEEFYCIPKYEDLFSEDGVSRKQLESVDEMIRAAEDIKNFR